MISNFFVFLLNHVLSEIFDAKAKLEDDEEELRNLEFEHTIILVSNVKDCVILIIDDLID